MSSIPRPTFSDVLYVARSAREVALIYFAVLLALCLVGFLASLTGSVKAVCLVGLAGVIVFYKLYDLTKSYLVTASDKHDDLSGVAFYALLGFLAGIMEVFSTLIQKFAAITTAKMTVSVVFFALSTLLGFIAAFRDPYKPGLAAKATKFVWSFEFCRTLYILFCGLWGERSFTAISTILGIPAKDTILPLWLFTPDRQAAAWELFVDMGPAWFYMLLVFLPLLVLLGKLCGGIAWIFQSKEKRAARVSTKSALIALGLVLLGDKVAARANHAQWLEGKIYIDWLGKGHPIDRKFYFCAEPFMGPEHMNDAIPCMIAAASDWEAEVERLAPLVVVRLPNQGKGTTKASFLTAEKDWKRDHQQQVVQDEKRFAQDINKDFFVADYRFGRAKGRAITLQRFLDHRSAGDRPD